MKSFAHLRENRGLYALLRLGAVANFVQSFIFQLIPPILLSVTTESVLGLTSSFAGLGMLFGSICVGAVKTSVRPVCVLDCVLISC